jgi:hypothetical protein
MNTTTTRPVTLGGVLFDEADGTVRLQGAIRDTEASAAIEAKLSNLAGGLREDANIEVLRAAAGVLDIDLVDVLLAGWRKYTVLTDAARRTLEALETEELIPLYDHRITSTHRPRIDLTLDEVPIKSIELEIDLTIELHAVRAIVTLGRLIGFRSGKADLQAELRCEGVQIVSATGMIDLPVRLNLDGGLPLLPPPPFVTLADVEA